MRELKRLSAEQLADIDGASAKPAKRLRGAGQGRIPSGADALIAVTSQRTRPLPPGRMRADGLFSALTRNLLIGSRSFARWQKSEHAWWARRNAAARRRGTGERQGLHVEQRLVALPSAEPARLAPTDQRHATPRPRKASR